MILRKCLKSSIFSNLWYAEANLMYATLSRDLSTLSTSVPIVCDVTSLLCATRLPSSSVINSSICSNFSNLFAKASLIACLMFCLSYSSLCPSFLITTRSTCQTLSYVVYLYLQYSHSLRRRIDHHSSITLLSTTLVSILLHFGHFMLDVSIWDKIMRYG